MGDESGENDIEFLIDFVSSVSSSSSISSVSIPVIIGDLWNGTTTLLGNEFYSVFSGGGGGGGEIIYNTNSASITNRENLTRLECYEIVLDGDLSLKDCVSLDYINFRATNLSIVDVSGCVSLLDIYGDACKLSSINIENCSLLSGLYINNNNLGSLDVGDCSQLISLEVSDNELTSIDLSNLENIEILDLSSNQLSSIDISLLSNLDECNISNNLITSIDFSGCPNVTIVNMSGLPLSSNSIDFSMRESLASLYINSCGLDSVSLTGSNNLGVLDCGLNNLTGLNLTGLDRMQTLIISGNTGLGSLEYLPETLSTLELNDCNFTSLDVSTLTGLLDISMNNNVNLVSINIGNSIEKFNAINCALLSPAIDTIFININDGGGSNGEINVNGGTNGIPTALSLTARTELSGRGWVLNFNS
jgi:hypothetical protein